MSNVARRQYRPLNGPLPARRKTAVRLRVGPRLVCAVIASAYAYLLWFNYRELISPEFTYLSFFYYDHELSYLLFDLIVVAIPALFLPMKVEKPSHYALILIYLIVYIPSILLTTFAATEVTSDHIIMKLVMPATFWMISGISSIEIKLRTVRLQLSPDYFLVLISALAVGFVVILGLTYGFQIVLHNVTDVYAAREAFKEGLDGASYNRFILGMTANVLGPTLMGGAIVYRRPWYFALGAAVALYVYSITGLKSSALAVIYVTGTYIVIAHFRQRALLVILSASLIICVIGIVAAADKSLGLVNDLFVRRTFMIQGLLTQFYFDFSLNNPHLYWSHSILSPFFNAPILANPDEAVGALYFRDPVHANASLWSDGFMNAGYVGVAINGVLVGAFLAVVDFCTRRIDLTFACCSLCMIMMMICQTGIVKVIGMHGGLFVCFIFFVIGIRQGARPQSPEGQSGYWPARGGRATS